MHEQDTRHLPYLDEEFAWARHRPRVHQTPIPAAGDDILYRHTPWADPIPATVVSVQSLEDLADPNLWIVPTAENGPALHEGRPVFAPCPDPWPLLVLRTPIGPVETREARLRGSPGWLPLDWEQRFRPVPDVYVVDVLGGRR